MGYRWRWRDLCFRWAKDRKDKWQSNWAFNTVLGWREYCPRHIGPPSRLLQWSCLMTILPLASAIGRSYRRIGNWKEFSGRRTLFESWLLTPNLNARNWFDRNSSHLHERLSNSDKRNWTEGTCGDKYQGNGNYYDYGSDRLYLRKPPITGTYPSLYFLQHLFNPRSAGPGFQQNDSVFHRFGEA